MTLGGEGALGVVWTEQQKKEHSLRNTGQNNPSYGRVKSNTRAKHYVVIDPQGNHINVYNLAKFCQEHKLTASNMAAILKGKQKQHKGWKCCYDE